MVDARLGETALCQACIKSSTPESMAALLLLPSALPVA